MSTLYTHQDSNIRKTWLLITAFLILVIGIGWVLSHVYESQIILIVAITISVTMSFISYWWSDKIVIKMTRAQPLKKEEHLELHRTVENLCITAGLPMPRLYILNERAPNAFATGRNPKNSVVAVTTGLLEILDKNELEGVLAHELSHIGNRDILVSTVAVVLAGAIAYATDIAFRSMLWGGGRRDSGPLMLVIGFAALLLAYLAATMLKMAISRKREFLADASGALLTRYPEGLASALEKISADGNRMKTASNATAHLFFESPFKADIKKGRNRSKMAKLFMTHPPVEERIKNLREMNK
ncbi:MAG: M48 family metalloprotease [Candidatus Spechtbacterales bacterium]